MPFFDKKDGFFGKNEQFSGLIKFYANRLKEPTAEADLWGFLFELEVTHTAPNDRYIAVCIRNEFIRLSKIEKKVPLPLEEISLTVGDRTTDREFRLDFQKAFEQLTKVERRAITQQIFLGYSDKTASKINGTSRQNESRNKKRALEKLRNSVILTGYC